MKKFSFILGVLFLLLSTNRMQSNCILTNSAFMAGEVLNFSAYYTLKGLWVPAGNATLTVRNSTSFGISSYYITGTGKSLSSYEWFFKVRDVYESYISQKSLLPLQFKRDIQEGNFKFKNEIKFDHQDLKAYTNHKTYKINSCTHDVISAIYYARNIDYDRMKVGEGYAFSIFIDDDIYNINVTYQGKREVKTKFGRYKALKLLSDVVAGNVFKSGNKIAIYVSDDKNRIPLRIESEVSVGRILVDLKSFSGLRYALTSRID